MANAKLCDRCKAVFQNGLLEVRGIEKHDGVPPGVWYDLCPKCLSDFDEWIASKRTEKM